MNIFQIVKGNETMDYIDNLISIVIITCNREKELKIALESCLKFADMDCEIIIVDNNSTDGTRHMIEHFVVPSHNNINIRSYFMNKNLGVAGARNHGLKMANSRVVFFLDDDAYFAEHSQGLSYAYNYLQNHSNVFALAAEINDLKKNCMLKEQSDRIKPKNVFSFIGACHCIRKDYVKTKDLYPAQLFYGAEERYACLSAYKEGYDVEYCEDIKVIHNPSNLTRASRYENIRNICINKFIVKKLTLPKSMLLISTTMFYLRLVKLCNIHRKRYSECYSLCKQRYIDNRYAINRLTFRSAVCLIKRYGVTMIL